MGYNVTMKLPHPILNDLGSEIETKWQRQFVANGRAKHEGIWRRTQEPETKASSGYHDETDARWKLVHFFDEYDLVKVDGKLSLCLTKPYLWWNTCLPSNEMSDYYHKTLSAMDHGGWNINPQPDGSLTASLGDLTADLRFLSIDTAESLSHRSVPASYKILECEVYAPSLHLTEDERQRPWTILHTGIRKKLSKGSPIIASETEVDFKKFVPFHLELGCGPSIEAGVPPLSHLHKTYSISNPKTHQFLFGELDNLPVDVFADPASFYKDSTLIYASALKAIPSTHFYQTIKKLFSSDIILNPVYTNNYDGLISDIGMKEYYMRKFEDSHIFPDVEFDPRAKALVVIGSHADRRKLQEQARTSGLQVIYVDPETYYDDVTKQYYPYPVESPQDEDIVYRMTADEFAQKILKSLLN